MRPLALDTSVAVPLLVASHRDHAVVVRWWDRRDVALSGHAFAETYSVLMRLPGDARVTPADAARLIRARFTDPLTLAHESFARLPQLLGSLGIAGGAVYDALVALAAIEHDADFATRGARSGLTAGEVASAAVVSGPRPQLPGRPVECLSCSVPGCAGRAQGRRLRRRSGEGGDERNSRLAIHTLITPCSPTPRNDEDAAPGGGVRTTSGRTRAT